MVFQHGEIELMCLYICLCACERAFGGLVAGAKKKIPQASQDKYIQLKGPYDGLQGWGRWRR